jgi:hypothetical protein
MMRIRVTVGKLSMDAELNDSPTALRIAEVLPVRTGFDTWGDEIYFPVPVHMALDGTAREEVESGDLGYWPTGNALCIFFGPTPVSTPGKIVPASAVNIVGRLLGDPRKFKGVMAESEVLVEAGNLAVPLTT